MAYIGELFKVLGKNEVFSKYCDEMKNGKSNNDVLEMAFNDNDLMTLLKGIIDDEVLIKNKMDTIIGQKRKGLEKKNNPEKPKQEQQTKHNNQSSSKVVNNDEHEDQDEDGNEDDNDGFEFKYKPAFPERVIWLDKYCFVEQFDHRMRLVNRDQEMFY